MNKQSTTAPSSTISNKTRKKRIRRGRRKILGILNQQIENVKSTQNINILTYESSYGMTENKNYNNNKCNKRNIYLLQRGQTNDDQRRTPKKEKQTNT